tara:strand:+ start:410 stop:1411 length:1002 start_codon:yes stop_codon:yes gene_type:complete
MIYLFLILIVTNLLILKFYNNVSKLINIYDKPDKKIKLHFYKTPLLGGPIIYLNITILFLFLFLNIKANIFLTEIYIYDFNLILLFLISSCFFFIGVYDDKFKINPSKKMILFILFIILLVFFDNGLVLKKINIFEKNLNIDTEIISICFTIFCFLAFINAFNFFDGINLQVGLYSIFIILIFLSKNILLIFWISLLLSIFFYLILNFKNKIFLGDSGSLLLSFIFSYFFIVYHNKFNIFSADEIFLIMIVPGLDMVRLFIQRLISKKNPLYGDRQHIHHLISKKFKNSYVPFLTVFLCCIPYLIYLIFKSSLIIIIISIIIYTLIFLKLKNI